jgi:hypothetical protein
MKRELLEYYDIPTLGLKPELVKNYPIPFSVIRIRIKLHNQHIPHRKRGTVGLMEIPLTGDMVTTWSLMKTMAGNQRK